MNPKEYKIKIMIMSMIIYPTSEVTRYVNLRSKETKVKPFTVANTHRNSVLKINTKGILMIMSINSMLQFKKLMLHRQVIGDLD